MSDNNEEEMNEELKGEITVKKELFADLCILLYNAMLYMHVEKQETLEEVAAFIGTTEDIVKEINDAVDSDGYEKIFDLGKKERL